MSLVGTRPILQDELRQYELHHRQQATLSLHEAGIRAIVTYRAKNPERLLAKLYQRNEERDSKYSSLDDIYSDICDLSGVRVALYFPKDRDKAGDAKFRRIIIKKNNRFDLGFL